MLFGKMTNCHVSCPTALVNKSIDCKRVARSIGCCLLISLINSVCSLPHLRAKEGEGQAVFIVHQLD